MMQSTPYLEWTGDDGNTHRLEIVDKVFFGRACKGISPRKCIILDNPAVSRDHAFVSLDESGMTLTDMSINGVWINNVRMTAGSSEKLKDGDTFQIGGTNFVINSPRPPALHPDLESTMTGPLPVVVTNLVADLRGFSGMVQKADSSQIYTVMREIFEALAAVVRRREGTVKDCVGDALFAFWDHGNTADGEKVYLACRAALEQAEAVDMIRASRSDHLTSCASRIVMGWGMTTGKVTLAHYGTRTGDLALVGDSTNLAFRLSGMAMKDIPMPIIMCGETAHFLRGRIPIQDLGSVPVRGRTGREAIYGIGQSGATCLKVD